MLQINDEQTAIVCFLAGKSDTLSPSIIRSIPGINTHSNLPILRPNKSFVPGSALVNIVDKPVSRIRALEEVPRLEKVARSIGVDKSVGKGGRGAESFHWEWLGLDSLVCQRGAVVEFSIVGTACTLSMDVRMLIVVVVGRIDHST